MRAILIVFLIALPLRAQFNDLATSADGEVLYFSSAWRQTGTGQPGHGKIFRATEAGIVLVKSIERVPPPDFLDVNGVALSNFFEARLPQIDPAGTLAAYNVQRDCVGPNCLMASRWKALLGQTEIEGEAVLSANARYAAIIERTGRGEQPAMVRDLLTGREWGPVPVGALRPFVGGDGSMLINFDSGRSTNQIYWVPAGSAERVLIGQSADLGEPQALLIEDGDPVAIFSRPYINSETERYDVALEKMNLRTREKSEIRKAVLPCSGFQFLLTSRYFAVCEGGQIRFFDGGSQSAITQEQDGVVKYVASADGGVLWYVTQANALRRLSRASGKVATIVRPVSDWQAAAMVPGSRSVLSSRGGEFSYESPEKVQVKVNGSSAPVLGTSNARVDFQAPWDVEPGKMAQVEVEGFAASELERVPVRSEVRAFLPAFVELDSSGNALIHEKWQALVTRSNPASAGEIVHAYMTGLGTVIEAPATGEAAPSTDVHRVTRRLRLFARYPLRIVDWDLDVIYAGLAPGTIGIYQVSIRIRLDGGFWSLYCNDWDADAGSSTNGAAMTSIWVRSNE